MDSVVYSGFVTVRGKGSHLQWSGALGGCIICMYWNLKIFVWGDSTMYHFVKKVVNTEVYQQSCYLSATGMKRTDIGSSLSPISFLPARSQFKSI